MDSTTGNPRTVRFSRQITKYSETSTVTSPPRPRRHVRLSLGGGESLGEGKGKSFSARSSNSSSAGFKLAADSRGQEVKAANASPSSGHKKSRPLRSGRLGKNKLFTCLEISDGGEQRRDRGTRDREVLMSYRSQVLL